MYNLVEGDTNQWLGMSKTDNLGGLQAADGSPQTITNWAAPEPNGHDPVFANFPPQECIESYPVGHVNQNEWNDNSCVNSRKFACRIEVQLPLDQADPADSVCTGPVQTKSCVSFQFQDTLLTFAEAETVCANLGGVLPFFQD